jgi:hypothetical protein
VIFLGEGDFLPQSLVAENAGNQRGVHGMAGAIRHDPA